MTQTPDETLSTIVQKCDQLHQRFHMLETRILASDVRLQDIQRKLQDSDQKNAQLLRDMKSLQSMVVQLVTVFSSNIGAKH